MSERPKARVIVYNGVRYTCTLSDRFRRHTHEEQDAMRASLLAGGVRVAIRLYRDTTLGLDNCILDGEGRLSLAAELDLPPKKVPFYREPEMDTETAYAQAKTLNDCRRHDDPEAIRKRRSERVERVAELRAEGKSLRAIAEVVGVSPSQVKRDIQDSGVPGGTPDGFSDTTDSGVPPGTPACVTGRDGKVYPATAPDRGDAWEPEDTDEDDQPELFDDGDDGDDAPEPQDETLPTPSIDASKPLPARKGKPPKPLDKDHPFYAVLTKLTALNTAITKCLRTEKGAALVDAFREAQVGKHHLPFLYFTHGTIAGDECKPSTVKFVGLHAMRHLIRKVGDRKKKITEGWAATIYQNALDVAKNGGGKPQ